METAESLLLTSCSAQNVRVFRKEIKQIGLRLQEEVEGMKEGSPSLTKEIFSVPGGVHQRAQGPVGLPMVTNGELSIPSGWWRAGGKEDIGAFPCRFLL